MNTTFTRSNAVFAFTLTNLAFITVFLVLSTMTKDYSQLANVKVNSVRKLVKNVADYSAGRERNDLGFLSFDLDADFTRVFDWNTKQLFLFLIAQYKTKTNVLSQVILWDYIMLRDNPNQQQNNNNNNNENKYRLQLRNEHTKYYFWDDGNGLLGNNITLTLSMNILPNSGFLPIHSVKTSQHNFIFPNQYDTKINM